MLFIDAEPPHRSAQRLLLPADLSRAAAEAASSVLQAGSTIAAGQQKYKAGDRMGALKLFEDAVKQVYCPPCLARSRIPSFGTHTRCQRQLIHDSSGSVWPNPAMSSAESDMLTHNDDAVGR